MVDYTTGHRCINSLIKQFDHILKISCVAAASCADQSPDTLLAGLLRMKQSLKDRNKVLLFHLTESVSFNNKTYTVSLRAPAEYVGTAAVK